MNISDRQMRELIHDPKILRLNESGHSEYLLKPMKIIHGRYDRVRNRNTAPDAIAIDRNQPHGPVERLGVVHTPRYSYELYLKRINGVLP